MLTAIRLLPSHERRCNKNWVYWNVTDDNQSF